MTIPTVTRDICRAIRVVKRDFGPFEEVQQVAAWTHARIARVLAAHGRSLDGLADEPPELAHDQPVLASCYAASAADLQLLGDTPGQRTLKLVQAVRAVRPVEHALAEVGGVNIHAEVAFDGRDHKRLEHVLRYMARPPLALDRLEQRSDGYIVYRFKKPWRDGTHAVVLSPQDFIARLCALVPPPRFHPRFRSYPPAESRDYVGEVLRAENDAQESRNSTYRAQLPLSPTHGGRLCNASMDEFIRADG